MYYYSDVEFAMCAIRVLGIILVVAFIAFALKNRAVFLAGSFGCLLGYMIPEHRGGGVKVELDGKFYEELYLGFLERSANHVFLWGIVGAVVASAVAFQVSRRAKCVSKQSKGDSGPVSSTQCKAHRAIGPFCDSSGNRKQKPQEFRRIFVTWFVLLIAGFLALNVLGFSARGSKRYTIGFPAIILEVIEVGGGRGSHFYPAAIPANVTIGIAIAGGLAYVQALSRSGSKPS